MSINAYSASPALASGRWLAFLFHAGKLPMRAFAALRAHLKHRAHIRRSLDHLHALDDRMLADIGLSRGEIDGVVRGYIEPPYGRAASADAGVDLIWRHR
jgi:uncharacterized protein YjiS (DUF1127 family)